MPLPCLPATGSCSALRTLRDRGTSRAVGVGTQPGAFGVVGSPRFCRKKNGKEGPSKGSFGDLCCATPAFFRCGGKRMGKNRIKNVGTAKVAKGSNRSILKALCFLNPDPVMRRPQWPWGSPWAEPMKPDFLHTFGRSSRPCLKASFRRSDFDRESPLYPGWCRV